jgi:hypothetical protein
VTAAEALTAFGGLKPLKRQAAELDVEAVGKVGLGIGCPLRKRSFFGVLGMIPAPVAGPIVLPGLRPYANLPYLANFPML